MPLTSYYSASDVRALPDDGKRYETVHGELLVTPAPAPRHQLVLQRLNRWRHPAIASDCVVALEETFRGMDRGDAPEPTSRP